MSKKSKKKPVKKDDRVSLMKEVIEKVVKEKENLDCNLRNINYENNSKDRILIALKKALWPQETDSFSIKRDHPDEDVITEISKIKMELQEKAALLEEIKAMNWYMVRLVMKDENLKKEAAVRNPNQQNFYP